ncbi:MAG: alkyl hydroperoxide reductase [Bradyrhizobium sp.]|nr:alkyl hydroperoxide reductase [Bradyrhizobium sp.]
MTASQHGDPMPEYLIEGAVAPAFTVVDPLQGVLRSADLIRQGHVLLTFYRGAWCQCCKADLNDLAQSAEPLSKLGVQILGVFHDLGRDVNAQIRAEYHLGFPLVDDPFGQAAEAFGIRRSAAEIAKLEDEFEPQLLALRQGQPWIAPMQARYVIGRDGMIVHAEVLNDYNDRTDASALFPMLEALG